jgi:hypothetical protein
MEPPIVTTIPDLLAQPLYDFADMNRLMGFPKVHAFEAKWTQGSP